MEKNISPLKKILLVIAGTGIFALAGFLIFSAYAEFLAANPMSLHEAELFAFKEILYNQTNGNPTTIEHVINAAESFFYEARSLGATYAELKLIKLAILSSLIPGLIGLNLSVLYLNREKVKIRISAIGEQANVWIPNKKQLLIAVTILCLSTYLVGSLGYNYRAFSINRNPDAYYTKVFEERNGEPLDPILEAAVDEFLRSEAFILEGVTEKEAEEAKSTFQIIGFILGIVIVGLMLYPSKLKQLRTNIKIPQTTIQVPQEAGHQIQAWYYKLAGRLRQMDKRKLLGALSVVIVLILVIKIFPIQPKPIDPENNQSVVNTMEEESPEDIFELITNGDIEKVSLLLAENEAILTLVVPAAAQELAESTDEEVALLSQEEAFAILLSSQNIDTDRETIEQGAFVVENEFSIHSLDDVKIKDTVLYCFESVSLGGTGVSSSYIVSSKTGNIYYDYRDVIMAEFNLKDFDYEIINGEKVYTINVVSLVPDAFNFPIYISENGDYR